MHAQPTTLQPASARRLDRFPMRRRFRRGRRPFFPSRGLARRLQFVSSPAPGWDISHSFSGLSALFALTISVIRSRVPGWLASIGLLWRDHRAALLFRRCLAETVALPFPIQ